MNTKLIIIPIIAVFSCILVCCVGIIKKKDYEFQFNAVDGKKLMIETDRGEVFVGDIHKAYQIRKDFIHLSELITPEGTRLIGVTRTNGAKPLKFKLNKTNVVVSIVKSELKGAMWGYDLKIDGAAD